MVTFKFQMIIHLQCMVIILLHRSSHCSLQVVSSFPLLYIGGAESRLPHDTQVPSTSSFPPHLSDPSTGNSVAIIVTVVSVVVILIITVVVCIVLTALLTCVKGSHHKQIDLQDNVCYTPSSRNDEHVTETQSE